MKVVFSLVILFVAFGMINAQCTQSRTCIKVGNDCPRPGDSNYGDVTCDAGSWCRYDDNKPSDAPGTCTAYVGAGSLCDDDTWQCYPGSGLSCYSNNGGPYSCQYTGYATAGESCESKQSCVGSMECIEGKCTIAASRVNKCSYDSDCAFGYSCNSTSLYCIPTLTAGQQCGHNAAMCAVGLVCSPNTVDASTNYSCVAINSKQEGAPCDSSSSFSLGGDLPQIECDISKSLTCFRDNSNNYVCQTLPALGVGNCTANYTCLTGQSCRCNAGSLDGSCKFNMNLGAECSKNVNNLVSCAVSNKCQFNTGASNTKSCIYRNCGGDICNSKCSPNFGDQSCDSSYLYSPCRPDSSSSFVRPSIFFAALIALVALLF